MELVLAINLFIFVIAPIVTISMVLYINLSRQRRTEQIQNFGHLARGWIIKTTKTIRNKGQGAWEERGYLHIVEFDDYKGERRTGECFDQKEAEVGTIVYLRYLPYEAKQVIIDWKLNPAEIPRQMNEYEE